ncbi:MAG: hypothetical protein RL375_831 [Pseudomonadota bacterium]|jgi:hypothetical protein
MNPHPDSLACTDLDSCVQHLGQQGLAVLDHAGLARQTGAAMATTPGAEADTCASAALAALAPLWNDLPPDAHLKDGGHYRQRRHASLVQHLDRPGASDDTLVLAPPRAHWQPTTYNALHGGMLRWFAPVDDRMSGSPAWRALVIEIGRLFARVRSPKDRRWYIEAHPFRITTAGGVGRPTPEGAHRDGVDFVAVVMVGRHQIIGGETRVFDASGPFGLRFTLSEPWSVLLLDDERVIHESTPIQPLEQGAGGTALPGWRDTLVLTYRSGGFQDPPDA